MKLTDRQLADELFATLEALSRVIGLCKEAGLKLDFIGGLSDVSEHSVYVSRNYVPTEE